jgi:chromosome segregation ATPase
MKPLPRMPIALALFALAGGIHAQSLEEQLRSQLRDARSQLQDLQSEQSRWQAQKTAAEGERDQARKALEQAQAELARYRSGAAGDGAALAAEREARRRSDDALKQGQAAAAQASAQLQQQQSLNGTLATQLQQARKELDTCTARNEQLYRIGNEVVDAYAHMDVGSVLAARQPFAASARVKLENAAQGYGDRLYEQRYRPAPSAAQP